MNEPVDHERWKAKIPDYLQHRLSESDNESFRLHVNACPKCRQALEEAAALTDGLRALARESDVTHPGAEVLVQYVREASLLSDTQRVAVEEHLLLCPSCAAAVDTSQAVLAESQSPQHSEYAIGMARTHLRPAWVQLLWHPVTGYLVAALLLIALGIPAWQTLQGSGDDHNPLIVAPTSPLIPQTRATLRPTTVERTASEDLLRLVVFSEQAVQGSFEAVLLDSTGAVVAAVSASSSRSTNYLGVTIADAMLEDGRYTLRLETGLKTGDGRWIDYPFVLQTTEIP